MNHILIYRNLAPTGSKIIIEPEPGVSGNELSPFIIKHHELIKKLKDNIIKDDNILNIKFNIDGTFEETRESDFSEYAVED